MIAYTKFGLSVNGQILRIVIVWSALTLILVLDHGVDSFEQRVEKSVVVIVGQQEAGR